MTFKVHEVSKYNYSFDARAGGSNRLQLWGSNGKLAEVQFVDDVAPVSAPILTLNLNSAHNHSNSASCRLEIHS
jgi:hypothetical protein